MLSGRMVQCCQVGWSNVVIDDGTMLSGRVMVQCCHG